MNSQHIVDRIVAHRGLSSLYPENTLLAFEKAIEGGARMVELDVQVTRDGVPIVFHDATFQRLCDCSGCVMETTASVVRGVTAHYPKRFGYQFAHASVLLLEEAVDLIGRTVGLCACVEIKLESVVRFGVQPVLDVVLRVLDPIRDRVQLVSFDAEVIEALHCRGYRETNWVVRDLTDRTRVRAEALNPSMLTCSIPLWRSVSGTLWPGDWDWMVYHTEDLDEALQLFESGVRYVETDDVESLVQGLKARGSRGGLE